MATSPPLNIHDITVWETSPLRWAATSALQQATQLVNSCGLVASLADKEGQILWRYANKSILPYLEGSNDPLNWVCYSAPIMHPQSGELHGVLTLGTLWQYHTPIGEMAATGLAQDIAQYLPHYLPRAELEIHALGKPLVRFRGQTLHLPPRMIEILCLLALNPEGLTLEACHAMLYGDEHVATTTLKAELSHLRTLLDGRISSRTYRLQGTVWVDFIEVWNAIRHQQLEVARNLYQGTLLPESLSPEIIEWRNCIATLMAKYSPT